MKKEINHLHFILEIKKYFKKFKKLYIFKIKQILKKIKSKKSIKKKYKCQFLKNQYILVKPIPKICHQ